MTSITGISYYSNIWTYRIIIFILLLWLLSFTLFITYFIILRNNYLMS